MNRDQYHSWVQKQPKGSCVFCKPTKDKQIILKEENNWLWIAALAPYWKYHTMLIPRKHYEDISQIPKPELGEMMNLYKFVLDKLLSANLKYDDGLPIYQYVMFWRIRGQSMQDLTGIYKSDHFHLHVAPDREHLLDPVMDSNAYSVDLAILKS